MEQLKKPDASLVATSSLSNNTEGNFNKNSIVRKGSMSAMAEVIQLVPDHDCPLDEERPVLIKPGGYEVALVRYWKGFLYGRSSKLILVFRIVTEGFYYGQHIYRCYNIKGLTKRKEIIPKGWHSDFVREYSRLFGMPRKLRDIGIRQFKHKVFKCRVRTVKKDFKQRPLPDDMQYSVIDELLEVQAG